MIWKWIPEYQASKARLYRHRVEVGLVGRGVMLSAQDSQSESCSVIETTVRNVERGCPGIGRISYDDLRQQFSDVFLLYLEYRITSWRFSPLHGAGTYGIGRIYTHAEDTVFFIYLFGAGVRLYLAGVYEVSVEMVML
jgi:hypothetical protein